MSGTYTGDCSAADFFQIDAASADGTCDIQYSVPPGNMSGIWDSSITLSGGTIGNAVWTIPAIAASCGGKTVSAQAAALWNGVPGSGTWIDGAETVAGSFKFAAAGGTTTTTTTTTTIPTTTTTTLPGQPFTLVIKPGWNLISVPYRIVSSVQLPDNCGVGTGNFYFYNAATGKWDVRTVGITSFKGATSYWFYSTRYCSVTVMASGEVAASDITLSKNEWNHVGAPKGGMNMADMGNARCWNCMDNKCSSMQVLYYDTAASQFKELKPDDRITDEDGRGYRVQCIGS